MLAGWGSAQPLQVTPVLQRWAPSCSHCVLKGRDLSSSELWRLFRLLWGDVCSNVCVVHGHVWSRALQDAGWVLVVGQKGLFDPRWHLTKLCSPSPVIPRNHQTEVCILLHGRKPGKDPVLISIMIKDKTTKLNWKQSLHYTSLHTPKFSKQKRCRGSQSPSERRKKCLWTQTFTVP